MKDVEDKSPSRGALNLWHSVWLPRLMSERLPPDALDSQQQALKPRRDLVAIGGSVTKKHRQRITGARGMSRPLEVPEETSRRT